MIVVVPAYGERPATARLWFRASCGPCFPRSVARPGFSLETGQNQKKKAPICVMTSTANFRPRGRSLL